MSTPARFQIVTVNDETLQIKLDGVIVAEPNHDDDGWAGMQRQIQLVENIAKQLGMRVDNGNDIV